jgi:hypothetical protein
MSETGRDRRLQHDSLSASSPPLPFFRFDSDGRDRDSRFCSSKFDWDMTGEWNEIDRVIVQTFKREDCLCNKLYIPRL